MTLMTLGKRLLEDQRCIQNSNNYGDLEISASTSWHWHWHSNIKIVCCTTEIAFRANSYFYILYSELAIFNKVTTSSIKGLTVIPCRKYSKIQQEVNCRTHARKPLWWSPFFNKIARMNSRPAFTKDIRILSAFSVRSNVNSGYGKIASCTQQDSASSKLCYTINILKNVLLRQLVSEKNLSWSLFIVGVQSGHCRLYWIC